MTCPHCGCTLFFDCECPETRLIFEEAIDRLYEDIVACRSPFRSLEEPRDG